MLDLLNRLPYAILILSQDLHITYANAVTEDWLQESHAYLCKRTLSDIFIPSQALESLIATAIAQGTPLKKYDVALSGPRCKLRTVTLHLIPMQGAVLFCCDDTSAALTLSHSIQHRQLICTQSTMAAVLAHEVKNPLASIKGAAQLLQKSLPASDHSLTSLICSEVDRIRSVVEEVEFFSSPSTLKTEPLNIHEVLRYSCALIENDNKNAVTVTERFDPSLPCIQGNRNLLVQAFLNLFRNAVEAGGTGTQLVLSTGFQNGLRLRADGIAAPLPILLTIEDNGPGIAEEVRETLFDPFITTKNQGKGLGLAVVAKIISDHGGIIELDTTCEAGTRFTVFLPMATT